MKNRSRKLTVIIGAALIAAPIVSAAQNASSNISNYELLQQIRNLQQEIAELRDRIDRQEYAVQQKNRVNSGYSNNNSQQAPTSLPSHSQTGSLSNVPEYSAPQQSPVVAAPQNNQQQQNVQRSATPQVDSRYGGPAIVERDLSGATPLGQTPAPATNTTNQGAPVESVDTSLRVEDRVISPQQPAQVSQLPVNQQASQQPRPSSSVANPQADLLRSGDKAIQTSLQEEDLYAKGLNQLKKQQYQEAVSLFNAQLQSYPRGQRSADAYYWIGESLYILENLDSSKKSYQSILTLFPSSRRAPNALFKVAKIEKEQGNDTVAKATLQSLFARYPKSSAATQARTTLADLL